MAKRTSSTTAKKETKPKAGKVPFKKEISQKLLDAKNKILQEVSQKVRSESNVLKYEIGDIYDIASNERERELALMLGDRDREKLSEIEDALERLRDNSYGVCEECGEPVAEERLRALPATRVCVECMSKMEKEQKIRGRFEEETGLGIMERTENEEEEF
ncbi:MAG: TraR/DksA family transcriptional regulator [Deltaproteobacteria bacterium]|nr:TraR/DksA family transcriptional regulator [Deltaproteobacteria bacterium]MCL4873621.1 TraR/DksA family transcriptional regulator [bacterium]